MTLRKPAHGLAVLLQQRLETFDDDIAIEEGSQTLSFKELHHRALAVAYRIRQHGVVKEEPVPILAARGIDHVIFQVAVTYAGATCVPLDIGLPDERIEELLRYLDPSILLTDHKNESRCPSLRHLLIDCKLPEEIYAGIGTFEIADNDPTCCNHIFFTSGSTGRPKAVRVLALGVINLILNEAFAPVNRHSRVAHVCNVGFDVSLWEIWSSLMHGGTLVVFSRHESLDPIAFPKKVRDERIDVMWQTTSLLATITHICPTAYSTVDTLLTGGEAINIQTIRTIFSHGPPRRLFNVYGPTELSVFTTYHAVSKAEVDIGSIPIGRPLSGYSAFVVDQDLRTVGNGTVGELLVGGVGVAGGYLGNAEKTAMVFVAAPHLRVLGQKSTGLLYRTGDLVRMNKDGALEYLGRLDNEVKIRGQRVDLESVERCLLATKLVDTTVALKVIEDVAKGGSALLAAFVVPSADEITEISIKQAYAQQASHLMIPRLKLVKTIALTRSGKVDRKKLAQEFQDELELLSAADEIPAEETDLDWMRRLWGEILGLDRATIGTQDDFFTIGGISLHAARLVSRINQKLSASLPVASLFESPTLEGMCEEVRKLRLGVHPHDLQNIPSWVEDADLGQDMTAHSSRVCDWRHNLEGRVFMTGATGFVGSFMLMELLADPQVKSVACLVRSNNGIAGLEKIKKSLEQYGLILRPVHEAKIIPLPGNLVHEDLGLGLAQYAHWANWTSVVFHLGAHINFVQPYSSHRTVNVLGTLNMIRFSQQGRSKALHYTSSISAYGPTGMVTGARYLLEDDRPKAHQEALKYDTGYAQSQFTAETILWKAIDRGLPITIHRLGAVSGHSRTGALNASDFVSLLVRSCSRSGVHPCLPRHREDLVPVDFVVSSMFHISKDPQNLGQAFNLVHPHQPAMYLPRLFELITTYTELPLREVPYEEWVRTASQGQDHALTSLMPVLEEKVHEGRSRWQMQQDMPTFNIDNLEGALSDDPGLLECPSLSELIKTYIPQWLNQIST
ncbi:putative NRPS-like enzyme [Aspergillus stella-maris]|uniref:putative NRPS-like enzyme n=1 Tax=Aspergillus stella-maris TaxID=1810926 RepID=UPI003CCD620F